MSNIHTNNTFIDLCINHDILNFGKFVLKSGRISPYFFNTGKFNNGHLIGQISKYYACLIIKNIKNDFMLYGPAYKGIPLVVSTALQLSQLHNQNVGYAFNRKEIKLNGEGGNLIGTELSGNVVILDDVITGGISVKESIDIIQSYGANPCAVIITMDRQERLDTDSHSTVQKLKLELNIPVYSLITIADLLRYLWKRNQLSKHWKAIKEYQDKYGHK